MPRHQKSPSLSVVPAQPKGKQDSTAVPTTVRDAADHSERALLAALRRKIASDIDNGVPAHALAPLARQLREVDRDIRALDARASEEEAGGGEQVPDEQWDASAL